MYKDKLCFFKALALQRGVTHTYSRPFGNAVRELFAASVGENSLLFEGVQLCDLPELEKLELNINVIELKNIEL